MTYANDANVLVAASTVTVTKPAKVINIECPAQVTGALGATSLAVPSGWEHGGGAQGNQTFVLVNGAVLTIAPNRWLVCSYRHASWSVPVGNLKRLEPAGTTCQKKSSAWPNTGFSCSY